VGTNRRIVVTSRISTSYEKGNAISPVFADDTVGKESSIAREENDLTQKRLV